MSSNLTPAVLKSAIVVIDPDSGKVQKVIPLQYNPESLTRTLAPQFMTDSGDKLEAMRLTGPPIETFKVDAEIDAADLIDGPDGADKDVLENGISGHLALLETLIYPDSSTITQNQTLSSAGTLEIAPVMAPQPLFVWGRKRVIPVRITEFTVTEEFFDVKLQPFRAKVSISMRVLTTNDVKADSKVGSLFLSYLKQKESAAKGRPAAKLGVTGVETI